MWHHLFTLSLLLSQVSSFELNCERESFKSKHYQPSLLTVSRLTASSYSVNLKCQGKTLDGIPILHDHVDVKHVVENSSLIDLVDGHFAKFISMSCGDACFSPSISEHDLLTSRVCLAGQKSCRQTVVVVADGYGDRDKEMVALQSGWRTLAAVLVMANILGFVTYCGCRLKRRNAKKQEETKSKQNSNHNSSHTDTIKNKTGNEENEDINYVNEYS